MMKLGEKFSAVKFDSDDIVIGLVRGRHEMPVDRFIWDSDVADPSDLRSIAQRAAEFADSVAERGSSNRPVSTYLLVTGLTVCLTAVIFEFNQRNLPLVLFHFDRTSGEYLAQPVLTQYVPWGE